MYCWSHTKDLAGSGSLLHERRSVPDDSNAAGRQAETIREIGVVAFKGYCSIAAVSCNIYISAVFNPGADFIRELIDVIVLIISSIVGT